MMQFPAWKIMLVVIVCLAGLVYSAPNLMERDAFGEVPAGLPGRQVNLGLDLQGGSYLLLDVGTDMVIAERLESLVDAARRALREARIGYTGLGMRDGAAVFSVRDPSDLEAARALAADLEEGMDVTVEGSRVSIAPTEEGLAEIRLNAVQQSIEIVRRRIDETGTREPLIQRQGDSRILVQLPGIDDPDRVKELLGQTAKLNFHLVDTSAPSSGATPPGTIRLPSIDDRGPSSYVVQRRAVLAGENLIDAQPSFQDSRPVVSFRLDTVGGRKFADVTSENVGRPFAIVLDGEVISAPVIQSPILGGSGIITGQFTVQQVQDLSLLLRAGALPAPLTVLEERTVGPGLGADSIEAGKIAAIVGMILVVVFMIVAYGLFGVFATLALGFNIALILGALSVLQATLTLPGIAGIVLTIGMAVDANVLIFERVREEIDSGRTPMNALDAGYSRALTTIIDSNLTTLFAAIFLFALGSGPIKGFAVTLAVGILTSMFTAVMVTRMFVALWAMKTKPRAIPI